MHNLLIYFTSLAKSEVYYLKTIRFRPIANTFEVYPIQKLPLCFATLNDYSKLDFHDCVKHILKFDINDITENKPISWCSSQIDDLKREQILYFLKRRYLIEFKVGSKSASAFIGPNETHIYSSYVFGLSKDKNNIYKLQEVDGGDPKSVNSSNIDITYSFRFVETKKVEIKSSDTVYLITMALMLSVLFLLLIKPNFSLHPVSAVVSTVPLNTYMLVIICGAGIGVLFYILTLLAIAFVVPTLLKKPFMVFVVPAALSSLASSIVTSILCSIWRLRDMASASYFAPLLLPALTLAFVFSVQWIPICVGACFSIPLKAIFYFFFSSMLVKIPINLIFCLITHILFRPPHYHHLLNVNVRKFTRFRKIYLCISNTLIFTVIFPWVCSVNELITSDAFDASKAVIFPYLFLWLLAAVNTGLGSVAMGDADDWALFSFLSSAGGGIICWIIQMIFGVFFEGMTGTLQLSLFAGLSGLVCTCFSLATGSISMLSSLIYIFKTGTATKTA